MTAGSSDFSTAPGRGDRQHNQDGTKNMITDTAIVEKTSAEILFMASLGWHLMPIRTREKNPGTLLGAGWQDQASCDPSQIEEWVRQYGECNWGVLLGPSSGLTDIEDDSPEGRVILEDAIEQCGVVTPCYSSGRSIHHVFQSDERMQADSCSVMQAFGTEWRFGKSPAQSIVPPSIHPSGIRYEWLPGRSPADVKVARLPDEMWQLFLDLRILEAERKKTERDKKRSQTKTEKQFVPPSSAMMLGVYTTHVAAAEALVEQYDWHKLFTDQGWRHYQDNDWTRPGDDWTNARSATLLPSENRMHVWSNAAPIDEGHYSKWRFWHQSHGFNDHEQVEAAKAFIGPERTRKVDDAFHKTKPGVDFSGVQNDKPTGDTKPGDTKKPRSSFAGIDASELSAYATQEPDWLVDGIFTIDEPLLVGARSKACKTLQLTDLAIAIASQTKWMGIFEVPKRRKVLFITGEANYRRIAKHIQKACKARGIAFADLKGFLRVEAIEFPSLPAEADRAAIRADVQEHGFEIVIIDPLYRGLAGVDSARLSEMGSAIKGFQAACAPAMMVLSHHVVKSAAREYGEPPQLEDMTGAGLAESCGQWWLVGRNEKYQWDWKHDLCIQFGGREGQGGGKRILFNEATWTFDVDCWHKYTEQSQAELQKKRDDVRRDAGERKRSAARVQIIKAVRNIKTPQSKNQIREACGAVQADFRYVFPEMVRELTLIQRPYRDSQNRFKSDGFLLNEYVSEYDKSEMVVDGG